MYLDSSPVPFFIYGGEPYVITKHIMLLLRIFMHFIFSFWHSHRTQFRKKMFACFLINWPENKTIKFVLWVCWGFPLNLLYINTIFFPTFLHKLITPKENMPLVLDRRVFTYRFTVTQLYFFVNVIFWHFFSHIFSTKRKRDVFFFLFDPFVGLHF